MSRYDDVEPINIGSGTALSISRLPTIIRKIVGFHAKLLNNNYEPVGMPEKLLDSTEFFTLNY